MKIQVEALGMGFNNTGYPGAFTPVVDRIIRETISGKVLNLFSGQSLIGDERVDITHANATINMNVKQFIEEDKRDWKFVVLDPPYNITRVGVKLQGYGLSGCISSDVPFRRKLKEYLQLHADNVLWLDTCAPMVQGFKRKKLWLLLPGGFHTVRVLSWLTKGGF
jgi:hypothetical protein